MEVSGSIPLSPTISESKRAPYGRSFCMRISIQACALGRLQHGLAETIVGSMNERNQGNRKELGLLGETVTPQPDCPLCKQHSRQPSAKTIAAIRELEAGGGKSCNSVEELMADLNADD